MRMAVPIFAIVAGFIATPALASDFTFAVPVRIVNMQNVATAAVNCDVYQGDGPNRRAIGFGRTELMLSDGAYAGTVNVNVDTASGYSANDATGWLCGLVYFWRMPDGTISTRGASTEAERASLYTRYTGQEVASFHTEEGGAITR